MGAELGEIVAWLEALYHKANDWQGKIWGLFPDTEDLFEHGEVGDEGLTTAGRERVERLRTTVTGEFFTLDEFDFFECPEVGDEIAIGHVELGLEVLKWPGLRAGCEQRHDGQAPFLVDGPIQLGEIDHAVGSSRLPVVTMSPP